RALVPGERAEDGGDGERDHADREDPPLPEEVAERPSDQDQRAQREEGGVGDPLLQREPAAEVVLDRGQGHVDDRRGDENDRRPEDAADEHQALAHPSAQIGSMTASGGLALAGLSPGQNPPVSATIRRAIAIAPARTSTTRLTVRAIPSRRC